MPSIRKKTTKDGRDFYEITVSRGRSKSRLYSRWYVPEGWSKRAIDRELAKVAAEFERQCKTGEVISRAEKQAQAAQKAAESNKIQTVYEYAEKVFMPSKAIAMAENSRSSFQSNLNTWIYPAIGNKKISEVTAADLSALLLSVQSKGKSHSTAVKIYTVLQSLFKMAYLSDTITSNPMQKVFRPTPRKDEIIKQEAQALTIDELQQLLTVLESEPLKWKTFIRLLIDTGMRRGECCGLMWEDIDLDNQVITVRHNLCYTPAKGVYLDTPKSGKIREVDFGNETLELLKALKGDKEKGYVFTQDDNITPIHPQSPTRYLKRLSAKCGISDLHPHKLRHTFASIAITAGADIAGVSEILGHSDKSVTLRMYVHSDAQSRKRTANLFLNAIKKADQE